MPLGGSEGIHVPNTAAIATGPRRGYVDSGLQLALGIGPAFHHIEDVEEPADLEDFTHLWLHPKQDQTSAFRLDAFGSHQNHTKACARDVIQIGEIQQQLGVAFGNQSQDFVFRVGGVAAVKLAGEADQIGVSKGFMDNHCKKYESITDLRRVARLLMSIIPRAGQSGLAIRAFFIKN